MLLTLNEKTSFLCFALILPLEYDGDNLSLARSSQCQRSQLASSKGQPCTTFPHYGSLSPLLISRLRQSQDVNCSWPAKYTDKTSRSWRTKKKHNNHPADIIDRTVTVLLVDLRPATTFLSTSSGSLFCRAALTARLISFCTLSGFFPSILPRSFVLSGATTASPFFENSIQNMAWKS